ncbi:unnamed protein product [Acanthoscelides obtectus]|uniref:TAFH domain-containing protein n=1 Tax=Acanthoscelides obtectus TaxID=200917 RepID=A0A9P0P0A5_ACAOB|nr:unnamed protein product [Acanthoscelides obtectus]CAK1637407.1 Transcription initiation factor TFIID subunit 4 [Acanthoscelides obtectus]
MASAKFLEEALSTDVDESAVNAIVGSLETQLVTAAPPVASSPASTQQPVSQQNHTTVSNGATGNMVAVGQSVVAVSQAQQQKHHMANGEAVISGTQVEQVNQQQQQQQQTVKSGTEPVKIVQLNQAMSGAAAGAILQNRVTLPNGTISLPQQKVVLKTSGGPGAPNIVTLPMQQANNVDTSVVTSQPQQNQIISGLQVVNVRPSAMQQQKGQPARVVLSAPQLVGARPGTPQLTLQSFHGLQPGQQGALLLKTENGQYQLLRVGPPPTAVSQATGQPVAYRMQTVPATAVSAPTPIQTSTISSTTPAVVHQQDQAAVQQQQQQTVTTAPQQQTVQVQQTRPANDNTKEKCRKFLANLLELSSREPKAVEKNVRTLIQELIDNKVEPEDFCDKLERLLNASPQPCLIGFLKKSLPLLRHSLATQEMTIDGIRPPAADVVFSVAGAAPTVQTAVRPGLANQVRIVGAPGATTAVNRPGQQVIQQRMVAPVRTAAPAGVATTVPISQMQVVRPQQQQQQQTIQPPALHPVFANSGGQPVVRAAAGGIIRQPVQVRTVGPGAVIAPRPHQLQIRQVAPAISPATHKAAAPPSRPMPAPKGAGQPTGKQQLKDKEKKTFQSAAAAAAAAASASAAYGGDDDINDVAAMGGVNLAEETQKILGSTEFVGTQIRSCKEEPICLMQPLQQKIRSAVQKYGLDDPTTIDVAACVSHAAQERLKNLLEKLAIITEHRLENVRTDNRYEVTNDVKGQLKFLEDLDKAERKRHEETERELLLRAAKSRSKSEDPEQAKLKAKAKEMQRVEMEELRQREANATALQAIGPRKRPKLDGDHSSGPQTSTGPNSTLRAQMPLRQRMKKVTLRDLQFLFETEKDLCKSKLLYRSYLK